MAKSAAEGLGILVNHGEFDDSDDEHEAPRRSMRKTHSVEKGYEYVRNLHIQAFITAKRSWRKGINCMQSILVTQ